MVQAIPPVSLHRGLALVGQETGPLGANSSKSLAHCSLRWGPGTPAPLTDLVNEDDAGLDLGRQREDSVGKLL